MSFKYFSHCPVNGLDKEKENKNANLIHFLSPGLTISRDGKVKAIHVSAGDKVADEDVILELE